MKDQKEVKNVPKLSETYITDLPEERSYEFYQEDIV